MNACCWKCGKELDMPLRQVPFRFTCSFCDAYQHCCVNCHNYQIGLPNNCKVPGTEYIADRENINFCEDFLLLGKPPKPKPTKEDIAKRLFGE